ncbi:MAG: FecR domain-containing protein [Pseudomonadota bacterium]
MSDPDDPDPDEVQRAEEAAKIFRRLNEDPEDLQAQREKEAFLARGEAERKTYARVLRAVKTAKFALTPKPKKPPYLSILVAIAAGTALYAAYEPVSIYWRADAITALDTQQIALASGDRTHLDASTALVDASDTDVRRVTLLKGAAFFEVQSGEKRFVVDVDETAIEVTGTAFEVARLDDKVLVAVVEGAVDVRRAGRVFSLGSGESLQLPDGEDPILEAIGFDTIATWREGFLVADGMTFGEVVEVLERRLPGPVIIIGAELASTRVSGRLNLTSPMDALRALAATSGATVRSAGPLGTLVSNR